jgi:hypothetical protein
MCEGHVSAAGRRTSTACRRRKQSQGLQPQPAQDDQASQYTRDDLLVCIHISSTPKGEDRVLETRNPSGKASDSQEDLQSKRTAQRPDHWHLYVQYVQESYGPPGYARSHSCSSKSVSRVGRLPFCLSCLARLRRSNPWTSHVSHRLWMIEYSS